MPRWLLLAFLTASTPALAYWHTVQQIAISGGAAFTGPGDVVSSAIGWWGLRGYNAAVAATGTQKSVNVRRAADNTTSDILILTNGNLDVTTAASFAGTDATCTGTIASTTLTCASASSTPTANDPVSGVGITQPAYIVSCGTFTGGAGTCTLNAAQTVGVGETITMQVALFVTEAYDQTGTGNHLLQATAGQQPQLLLKCLSSGTLPCFNFLGSASQSLQSGAITSTAQPLTSSVVGIRTATFTASNTLIGATSNNIFFEYTNVASTLQVFAGAALTPSAADSAWHAFQGIYNGASSVVNVDNTQTSGSLGTDATGTGGFALGIRQGQSSTFLTGSEAEAGFWPSAFTTPQQTSMCHNQFSYWATSVSC